MLYALDPDRVSRSNGSLVAKGSCTLIGGTAGLSAATAVARAWRALAMGVLLVSAIVLRDKERSLRLSLREVVSSVGVLMMNWMRY